jgi:hypothetical protein
MNGHSHKATAPKKVGTISLTMESVAHLASPAEPGTAALPAGMRAFRVADCGLTYRLQSKPRLSGPTSASLRLLHFWHLASLDAPTVAVVWSLALAWAAQVALPGWAPLLLGLVTWWIYTLDRLLDAHTALRAGTRQRLRGRHRFHWRNRKVLFPLALSAAAVAAGLIVELMPPLAVERNSVLGAATLAYFTRVHSSPRKPGPSWLSGWIQGASSALPTPILIGVLFTAACLMPTLGRTTGSGQLWAAALGLDFALLAWLNCHAIKRWESTDRKRTGTSQFSPARLLALGSAAFALAALSSHPRVAAMAGASAISALLLDRLDVASGRLAPLTLRAAADLVLLTPLAMLLSPALFPR